MHPAAIVSAAVGAGLDGFVLCDHNAADNVAAAERAARAAGCVAVPGMEITTEEEVHLVALLPDAAAAGVLHARVAAALPGANVPDVLGLQVIANERAEVLGFNPSRLSGATTWPIERAVDEIHRAGGVAIAAHVDRERFGLVGQLGLVPPGLPLDAVEVSANTPLRRGRRQFAEPLGAPGRDRVRRARAGAGGARGDVPAPRDGRRRRRPPGHPGRRRPHRAGWRTADGRPGAARARHRAERRGGGRHAHQRPDRRGTRRPIASRSSSATTAAAWTRRRRAARPTRSARRARRGRSDWASPCCGRRPRPRAAG